MAPGADAVSDDRAEQPHPSVDLDDVVHHRARLGILTVLGPVRTATFPYLKSVLQLTDGNLGRHLEVLAAEGLVTLTRGYEGRRPRTWVAITDAGYQALAVEMATLKQLVGQFEQTAPTGTGIDRPPS
jgi:DNA-binding MarR family transcriptional regulator